MRTALRALVCSALVLGGWLGAARAGATGRAPTAQSAGSSRVQSVSCPSRGSCAAAGIYRDRAGRVQGFVLSERRGTWGPARPIPGLAALNVGGVAFVDAVSCGAPGNCAVAGTYEEGRQHVQAFVASENKGTWRNAIEIPGLGRLNRGGFVYPVLELSCASAGNCAAGGAYTLRSRREVAFVADEVHGAWRNAHQVPGIQTLDARGNAEVTAISCAAPGSCSAAGDYSLGGPGANAHFADEVFVASESHGRWRVARAIPGLAGLHPRLPQASGISCGSPGNCAVTGPYVTSSGYSQSFVAGEVGGVWTPAQHLAGPLPRRRGADLTLWSVACAAPGECAAGGTYETRPQVGSAAVADERQGAWTRARALPGPGALGAFADPVIISVSCASPGECSAGGSFSSRVGHEQPFVVSEHGGVWGPVMAVPGSRALDAGRRAYVASVSCGAPGDCAAGGAYNAGDLAHAFVVTEKDGVWGRARAIIAP